MSSRIPKPSVILRHLFNFSLSLERMLVLWNKSCVVPVPKKRSPIHPQ